MSCNIGQETTLQLPLEIQVVLLTSRGEEDVQSEAGAGVKVILGHGDQLVVLRQDGRAQPS